MKDISQYAYITIFLIIAYIYSITIATHIHDHQNITKLYKKINSVHESCIIGCKHPNCRYATAHRGTNYYIGNKTGYQLTECLATYWNIVHFLFFFMLGLLFPDFLLELIIIGVMFEVYEYFAFRCHDPLDIFYNTTGLFIGYAIRVQLDMRSTS